jgi:hypothetical protein
MLTISQSSDFAAWLKDLADQKARHRAGKTDGKRIEGSQPLNVKISVKPKDTIRTVSTRKTSKPRREGQAA